MDRSWASMGVGSLYKLLKFGGSPMLSFPGQVYRMVLHMPQD